MDQSDNHINIHISRERGREGERERGREGERERGREGERERGREGERERGREGERERERRVKGRIMKEEYIVHVALINHEY